jgi:hypothetical protein
MRGNRYLRDGELRETDLRKNQFSKGRLTFATAVLEQRSAYVRGLLKSCPLSGPRRYLFSDRFRGIAERQK